MGAIQTTGEGFGVRPYVRGIGWRVAARGAFLRFLPACFLGMVMVDLFMGSRPSGFLFLGYSMVGLAFSGVVTLGYWLGLEGLRRRLYPDAALDGRRSVVAGLLAGAGVFSLWIVLIETNWVGFPIIVPGTGFALAMAMFLPWLSPTPGMAEAGDGDQG